MNGTKCIRQEHKIRNHRYRNPGRHRKERVQVDASAQHIPTSRNKRRVPIRNPVLRSKIKIASYQNSFNVTSNKELHWHLLTVKLSRLDRFPHST